MTKRIPQIVNGTKFKALKSVAAAYSLSYEALSRHTYDGLTWEQAVKTQIANRDRDWSFVFAGKTFASINDFAACYGIHRDAIGKRIRAGMSVEDARRAAVQTSYSRPAPHSKLKHCGVCQCLHPLGHRDCKRAAPFTAVRQCSCCGKWHKRTTIGMHDSFCSACAIAVYSERRAERDERKSVQRAALRRAGMIASGHHHRRHKLHGTKLIDNTITAKAVAERHDHTCQVCGRTVERHLGQSYQPLGWTIGHITPLAHGGNTTWDNVQCECVQCNSWKGNSQRANPPWSVLPPNHKSAA
jgi:5-methylcytosine-specific restriction endonuclease McrA